MEDIFSDFGFFSGRETRSSLRIRIEEALELLKKKVRYKMVIWNGVVNGLRLKSMLPWQSQDSP